jgi:hypothetical protein
LSALSPQDLQQLQAHGIGAAEAQRQAGLLAAPPPPMRLARPCTVGDGILRLDAAAQADAEARGAQLLKSSRAAKFVPASGAATRMFKDLLGALEADGGMPPAPVAELLNHADRFAFYGAWKEALGDDSDKAFNMRLAQGGWREALQALLFEPGLGYAAAPKAFLDFHLVEGRARTALEEHWLEVAQLPLKRLHFTVSPEHEAGYHARVGGLRPLMSFAGAGWVDLGYSFQDPGTDTLAGDGQGGLFRDDAGRLVLRPGGHGSLIRNLQALGAAADVAVLKNIDNIAHPRLWAQSLRWKRVLAGVLAQTLEGGWDRPVRVCGVVPNTGEPGGGPFWVQGEEGESAQIVESAQMGLGDPAQASVFKAATHFNPVDLVCRLTDKDGQPFDLDAFVDPSAVFLSQKTHLGRPLIALERPGLWNGAMAKWKTVFVEVPLETFNPVKTVLDLLKPAHQPEA